MAGATFFLLQTGGYAQEVSKLENMDIIRTNSYYAEKSEETTDFNANTTTQTTRPRTVLIEVFTASSCGPCAPSNNTLKSILAQNDGMYSLIKYQMYFPGTGDPYYTLEGGSKANFYNVGAVPHVRFDGIHQNPPGQQLSQENLVNRQNVPALMDVGAFFSVAGQTVDASVTIMPAANLSGANLRLFIAIVEKVTKNNIGINGETEFYQVMKKFMPDANGILIGDLVENVPLVFDQTWEFKGNYRLPANASNPINHNTEHSVEDFNNLAIVAWVQNTQTGEVLQSFYPDLFTVNYGITGGNGTISATKADGTTIELGDFVDPGTELIFNAEPEEGFQMKEWTLNGTTIPDNNTNELEIIADRNMNVVANFQTTHLNVKFATFNEFGTITATIDDNEIDNDETVLRGTKIVFTANPHEGYEVRTWRNNETVITGNSTNQFVIEAIDDDANVTVEFQTTHIDVTFSAVNNFGTISATANGEEFNSGTPIIRGARVVFTAKPNNEEAETVDEWRNNGILISGNKTLNYTISSVNNNSVVTVKFIEDVGIENKELTEIGIYPNPVKDKLSVTNSENIAKITITNILGQTVLEKYLKGEAEVQIGTESLAQGIYFITMQKFNGDKAIFRIVKQ